MAHKILLIEDDKQIREVVEDYFRSKADGGLFLDSAATGGEGLDYAKESSYDLILLDVMLPDLDGFSICRSLRKMSDVPIIFLTARVREEDRLYGYELGCDDYICKPFSLAELFAKCQALLKRSKGLVTQKEITCGAITLNPLTLEVTVSGKEIELPPKEFEILSYLMQHQNWVVSRDSLLDHIWGTDYFGGTRIVDNHVKKLRKALGESGAQIKTVISKGYKITE